MPDYDSPGWHAQEEHNYERDGRDYWQLRCICGDCEDTNVLDDDVVCDGCMQKLHRICFGVDWSVFEFDADADRSGWYCGKCRPQDHPGTVMAMERGEPIWEVRAEHDDDTRMRRNVILLFTVLLG